MKTLSYSIPNINCQHCVNTIHTALEHMPGIDFIEADPKSKTLIIEGSNELNDESIRAKLIEIGFPAK
jgi:copper chaperone CopZ